MSEPEPVTLLYVEDEENDVLFMRRALERVAPGVRLHTVTDGQQALDYLAGKNAYANRVEHPLPALVLLDLNLPVLAGFDVLGWMRQQPQFKELPVVVFSSSPLLQDRQKVDALGANGYLQKPSSPKQFRELVEQLKERWLSVPATTGRGRDEDQPAPRMRKLIQSKATKAFLAKDGAWTMDCAQAAVFPTVGDVRQALVQQQLRAVDLYYLFGEEPSMYDFTISLS